jgi:small multidrug resistance pump
MASNLAAWVFLLSTILLEVGGTIMMKMSNGFEKMVPSVAAFALYGAALCGLTIALKSIDLSVAYAIWSGGGTALTTFVGIWYFGESLSPIQYGFLGCIIVGVVGLQLNTK